MENNLVEVLGFGCETVIGHWNEDENVFYPLSTSVMNEQIKQHIESFPIFPIIIQVKREKDEDGKYYTYRNICPPDERSIVVITNEDIIKTFIETLK